MKKFPGLVLAILLTATLPGFSQKHIDYNISSPDASLRITVNVGEELTWSVKRLGKTVIMPSTISMELVNGESWGKKMTVIASKITRINKSFAPLNYKKALVNDVFTQLSLTGKGGYGVVFRAYDDGIAYRFYTSRNDSINIKQEQASFNFDDNFSTLLPYVRDLRGKEQYVQSFEALYTAHKLSQVWQDTLAFLPMLVKLNDGIKTVILEADLEDYPGMFLKRGTLTNGLVGEFAPFALEEQQGGYNKLNEMVTRRANFIASTHGPRNFPWRAVIISAQDTLLLNSDMVQRLASPPRLTDVSWIKPGKVAWDWWNDWNISHVDFKAGINTKTYQYYIDFAAANHLEYIILDEGWSGNIDLMQLSPQVNLQQLIDYGKQKGVRLILWASWSAITEKMEAAFSLYSKMGVAGFKIDFMDRDDQRLVADLYKVAKRAADFHLLVDFHGMYKPTGLQRTFPNVLNFEGVKGMENNKWTPNDDVPQYDVTIPFIRMAAGPMDYTPGAMRNATKSMFHPNNSMPMSQGTRCHQLAMYVIFEAPLQMLADNPTAYMKEQESTDFISSVPTTFDQTVALAGSVGEYAAIARRKSATWYVGAMTNWTARDLDLDLSFLGSGKYTAVIYRDGVNADRDATDYQREQIPVDAAQKLHVHLAPGGGWAARIVQR